MAKFEVIPGSRLEFTHEAVEADMSAYHIAPLTPEQLYGLGVRATEELDRYEAYQKDHPAEEEPRHLHLVEGEQ
jgi:hypothetical protein